MSNLTLLPEIRHNKNFIFKGKKYPVDFNLIKQYSNYFYDNQIDYEQQVDIEIPEPKIEITDDDFQNFVFCCQNQKFQLSDSNVFPMHQLSQIYKVPGLLKITNEYISDHGENLLFKSINFKNKNELNSKTEEDSISSNLIQYIKNEQIFTLPISVLYRILNDKDNSKIDQNQIIEFLFKCLDHYGQKASVLFTNFNFENKRIKVYSKLVNDYSDIFDFNMINPKFLLNTTNELLNDLNKLKIEYSNSIHQMKKLMDDQKIQFENQMKMIQKLQNNQKDQIIEQKELFNQAENDRKIRFENQLKSQDKRFAQHENAVKDLIDKNDDFITEDIFLYYCFSSNFKYYFLFD